MCYTKCQVVNIYHFKRVPLWTNIIMLTISGSDTLRPLSRGRANCGVGGGAQTPLP